MRCVKVLLSWSSGGSGSRIFHSQRLGKEKPRVLAATVDRGFCPQSIYGIKTYDHKYTVRLENSDGELDKYRALWQSDTATVSAYAADDSTFDPATWATDTGATDLKFARYITRVIVTLSEVIIEADGGNIRKFLDVRLAQLYPIIYNTFAQNKPQLWAAGRVQVDVDALQIVGASTDFDTGSRAAEVGGLFVNGVLTSISAAVGAGDFSVATTTVASKRAAAILRQPSSAAPASAKDAFKAIMDEAGFIAGATYVDTWGRGSLDETALIGVSAREETRLETIEKIIAGFDAGLYENNTGKIVVACLQDFYDNTTVAAGFDLTKRRIDGIELETAPFDGLGRIIAWNQNDAVHSQSESALTDTYNLQAPSERHDSGSTFAGVYNSETVKARVYQTWFNDDGTSYVAYAEDFLEAFYAAENVFLNITAPGFDLQELNPGDKVLLTHDRFDLGIMPNKFQLISLRYDLLLLSTRMQLIGKKRL